MSFVISLLTLVILRRYGIVHISDCELILVSILTEVIMIAYIILGYLTINKNNHE